MSYKSINILFVTYNLNTYSGAAFQALKLANKIKPTHNIVICNFTKIKKSEKKYEYNENDILVIDVFDNIFSNFIFLKILLKYKIKIVHFHVFLSVKILISKLFIGNIILKTTLLGSDDFETAINSTIIGFAKKWVINFLDYNIVLSDKMKKINSCFFRSNKILKIPNAVELPQNIYRKKNEIYCCVGIICERKQVLESIKFYHQNLLTKKSIFYIIGPNSIKDNTPEFTQAYYNKCIQYIRTNNLENSIIFTGNLSKNDLMYYYKISKSIIHFSKKKACQMLY